MTFVGIKELVGGWLHGLIDFWNTISYSTYDIMYSVFGESWDTLFDGINAIFPDFANYLRNDSLLMFALSTGLTFYISWSIATWILNIIT